MEERKERMEKNLLPLPPARTTFFPPKEKKERGISKSDNSFSNFFPNQISSIFYRTVKKYSNLLKRFRHEELEEKWKKERNGCKKIFFLFLPRERLSFLQRRKRSEELASLIILFLISSVSQIPKSNFEYILSNS